VCEVSPTGETGDAPKAKKGVPFGR
jgi:hypothetical protein